MIGNVLYIFIIEIVIMPSFFFLAFPVYKSFYTSENVFISTLIRVNVIIVT